MWNEHAKITIIGVDDSEWVIHGPGSKSSPVRLREGDLGEFYDAPFSSSYKGVVGRAGKRYTGHHFLERNIVLDLHIYADSGRTWGQVDSDFRRAFDPELEATIVVETELSGERWIKVRLGEHPSYQGGLDPHETTGGDFQYVLVAANPYWCSGTVTDEFVFSGSNWYGDGVRVSNPGDVPAWPKWVLTAPAKYGLPDVSWRDDADKDRMVFLPFQPHGREVLVDTDPHEEMITANDGTLLWAKMNGQFFQYPIPGRTPSTVLPVYVDPFPMLPFNLPVEWRIWIAQKMREWAEQLGLTAFLALTPEDIGNKIRSWMDGTIPDWVPVLSSDILAEMTGAFIANLIRETYGRIGNIAGATAQVRVDVLWSRPWGLE